MPMPSVDNGGNDLPNIYHTFVNHVANCAVGPHPIVQSATKRQNLYYVVIYRDSVITLVESSVITLAQSINTDPEGTNS